MNTGPEFDFFDMPDDQVMSMSAPPVDAAPAADIVDVVDPNAAPAADVVVPTPTPAAKEPDPDPEPTQEELDAQQKKLDDEAAAALGAPDDQQIQPKPADAKVEEIDSVTGKPKEKAPEPKLDADGKPIVEKTAEELAAEKAKEVPAPAAMTGDQKAAAYDELLKPIKANGKELEIRSPEELRRLAQMGANYTKKMQALQPQLRLVTMLTNSKLDESALSYLIDLHQKKPEAIQKLLSDSQFDVNTVDADVAKAYVPGDHQVSDDEVKFQAVLEEISSTPTGPALLQEVTTQWDAESKEALFKEPRIFAEINDHKASGLFERISSEVERERALGNLQGVPFLHAYYNIGKQMHEAGLLAPAAKPAVVVDEPNPAAKVEEVPPKQEPVASRVAAPAPKVANDAAAKAASSTNAPPAVAKEEPNYLDMPDEEFAKSMLGRV